MGADELVWWTVSLLSPDERDAAVAELEAHGIPGRPAGPHPLQPAELVDRRLRAADTVARCDAALTGPFRLDWPGLAAAHDRRPYGRPQRRALVARPDCPDDFTLDLTTPWDPLVAARLSARRREVPGPIRRALAARIGEVRPALVRAALADAPNGEETAAELITAVPHLELLVRAVDGFDHNHVRHAITFWTALAELLRPQCGDDPRAWHAASANAANWPGTFASLLRQVVKPRALPTGTPDPRLLTHAPGPVLAEIVGAVDDWSGTPGTRGRQGGLFLEKLVAAGVAPRPVFAEMTYAAYPSVAVRVWAAGLLPRLDELNRLSAMHEPELRRALAALRPHRTPVTDLVAELRGCPGAIEAEAVLAAVVGDLGDVPWAELERAHQEEPLSEAVLCALADRPGFPPTLVTGLSARRLPSLARSNAHIARATLVGPGSPHEKRHWIALVRAARTLADDELLATARPAQDTLQYLRDTHRCTPDDLLVDRYATIVRHTARAGFWIAFHDAITRHDGPLTDLIGDLPG